MSVTWRDGVTVTIEIALSAAVDVYAAWDSGLWDTATWGPDVVWTDVSTDVRRASTDRAFDRNLQAWQAGSATFVLDNRNGQYSPSSGLLALAGTGHLQLTDAASHIQLGSAGATDIRPWRPIRFTATYNGVTYPVFRGYVLAWEESYAAQGHDALVTLPCVDELGHLAGFNGYQQTPRGAGEPSGLRLNRILDNAGNTMPRDIDVGRTSLQATTLAQNAVTEAKLTADSEGGAFWVDTDGTLLFRDRYALLENTRSNTVQATFGDTGTDLPYHDVKLAYNGELIANIVAWARANGTAQISADNTSRALYGDLQNARSDLVCETDQQVLDLTALYLATHKDPEQLITSITITPRRSPTALFPQVLGRKVRDLITVNRHPPGGNSITRDVYVAGVHHDVGPAQWTTTFDLWSATIYRAFTTSQWDVGTWDRATFFY